MADDTLAVINLLGEISARAQLRLAAMGEGLVPALVPFQGKLLALIGRKPGWSQQQLAAAVQRDKAQVARTVKELEALGLVAREAAAGDWRSRSLRLTEAGAALFAELQARRAALGAEMLGGLSAEQRVVLGEMLVSVRDRLKE